MMNNSIRILLIEDHEMVRAGFRMMLDAQPDMEIVAEADNGIQGIELANTFRPDVILLDVSMPGMSGAETARAIKRSNPEVAILVVTIHDSREYLLEMLDAGVDGYLPKKAAADELVTAIRQVYQGKSYVYTDLIDALVEGYRAKGDKDKAEKTRTLTTRQLQVLQLVADGLTSHKVASQLELSVRTVDRHIENMMRRLNVHSRLELVKIAIREGLIEINE